MPDTAPASYKIGTYEKCLALPSAMYFAHAEGMRFMKMVADVKAGCTGDVAQECFNSIFSFADVSKDERLSVAELSRMIRILAYASVAATPSGVTEEDLSGAMVLATLMGPWVASSIISGSDYDSDGQLSMDEIFYDREVIGVKAALDKMSLDVVGSAMGALLQGLGNLPGLF